MRGYGDDVREAVRAYEGCAETHRELGYFIGASARPELLYDTERE